MGSPVLRLFKVRNCEYLTFSIFGFEGNRFHYWTRCLIYFSRGQTRQMEVVVSFPPMGLTLVTCLGLVKPWIGKAHSRVAFFVLSGRQAIPFVGGPSTCIDFLRGLPSGDPFLNGSDSALRLILSMIVGNRVPTERTKSNGRFQNIFFKSPALRGPSKHTTSPKLPALEELEVLVVGLRNSSTT